MAAFKRSLGYVFLLALIAFPFVVYFKAQALTDWWQLRGYDPPAAVSQLASQDTMTGYARHVFYVNHPDLEKDSNQFRKNCNENEQTIVLGCYRSDQRGIFLYDVQDARLAGVEQVTSAHEMLHAAYDRLSHSDKTAIDAELMDYYNNGLKDQRIKDTIDAYRKTEPNDLVNEMHSIFGTEVSSLPTSLESYYQKYFTDRQAVVSFAQAYEGEFTSRQDQIKADDLQLEQMKSQISAQEDSLNSQLSKINSDRQRLDSLRSSGQISAYNAGVAPFNAEVRSYNNGVQSLRDQIKDYNQLVEERNSIAQELTSLDKALDTRLVPQAAQ
jgi:uncharacterized protein YukE